MLAVRKIREANLVSSRNNPSVYYAGGTQCVVESGSVKGFIG